MAWPSMAPLSPPRAARGRVPQGRGVRRQRRNHLDFAGMRRRETFMTSEDAAEGGGGGEPHKGASVEDVALELLPRCPDILAP